MNDFCYVFIHGWLGNANDWNKVSKNINAKHKLFITIPGHNSTAPLNAKNGFNSLQFYIKNKLLTHKQIILIGYSLGGRIALSFAKHNPSIIKRLILISTHPGTNNKTLKDKQIVQEIQTSKKLKTLTLNHFLDDWYNQSLFSSLSTSSKQTLIQKRIQNNPNHLNDALNQFSHRFYDEHYSFLKTIASKTLYIVGEKDKKYFCFAKELKKLNVNTSIISNGSHALVETHPKTLSKLITSFLKYNY